MYSSYFFRRIPVLLLGLSLISAASCKKFLDEKPEKTLATINSPADCQAILDLQQVMNYFNWAGLQQLVGDEYYLSFSSWSAQSPNYRAQYVWDPNPPDDINQWSLLYHIVYNSNVVLEELPKFHVSQNEFPTINDIKGQALFYRAFVFYHVAQLYAKPYDQTTANIDPGIPTRTLPDIEVSSERGTVQQTYDRIISDLKEAATLLPNSGIAKTRPCKAAAFGALSRVYLSMRDYANAGKYSDSALQLYNAIIDFNTLDSTKLYPFSSQNPEIIFQATGGPGLTGSSSLIDSNLYLMYTGNDLRRAMYFLNTSGNFSFKGFFDGFQGCFQGITTDELYLTRAECAARNGLKDAAINDLNTLLIKRWKAGTFSPLTAVDATDALNKVLAERRKELVFRGTRWMDLRRFNLDGANISLKRVLNGINYSLPANDKRWILLIPQPVIDQTSMQQNPR